MERAQEISSTTNITKQSKIIDEFLLAMIRTSSRKKILIHFRFKNNAREYRTWLTYKQYLVFRTIDCIDYCQIVPYTKSNVTVA